MNNILIEKIYTFLKDEYEDDEDYEYASEFLESEFIEEYIDILFEIHTEYSASVVIRILVELGIYSHKRFIYAFFENENGLNREDELSRAVYFTYLSVLLGTRSCKCLNGAIEIPMFNAGFTLSLNLICNSWQESSEIGDYLIDSLNAKNCIIRRGDATALKSWFVIELYSIVSNNEFSKRRALYPKDFSPYDAVLKEWNTEELKKVDAFVTTLSDEHLETSLMSAIDYAEQEEMIAQLEIPAFQIFPYEILAWLKLREKAGLKNPTNFTHPLMNTPITRMFLELKEPLAKPKELPYAKELLEKLKEKCPNVEVPEWLDDVD